MSGVTSDVEQLLELAQLRADARHLNEENNEMELEEDDSCLIEFCMANWKQVLSAAAVLFALAVIVIVPLLISFSRPNSCQCLVNLRDENQQNDQMISVAQLTCEKDGNRRCFAFCTTLAQISSSTYESLVCNRNNSIKLDKPYLYYWDCLEDTWKGAHPLENMCCNDSVPVFCN